MRRAHFIVGFNSWGKSTIIFNLFSPGKPSPRYQYASRYNIPGINAPNRFMVQSQSNDDVGENLKDQIALRITSTLPHTPDLVSALCPSMERHNNFLNILGDPAFDVFQEFHFYLLKYKWEHHAELRINDIITAYGTTRPNSRFHIIDDGTVPVVQRTVERERQIRNILTTIYP